MSLIKPPLGPVPHVKYGYSQEKDRSGIEETRSEEGGGFENCQAKQRFIEEGCGGQNQKHAREGYEKRGA